MNSEHVLYLVKPEGLPYRGLIEEGILKSGLSISFRRPVVLSSDLVLGLYSCSSGPIIDTALWWLVNKTCELGVVVGSHAIVRLAELCGTNPNPAWCGPGTWRRRFGTNVEPLHLDEQGQRFDFYFTLVHCARNAHQADHDLALFKSVLTP